MLLSLTNDWERFVCEEHRHLDTSKQEFDVTWFLTHSPYPRESWPEVYRHICEDGRWLPINVPAHLAKPEQLHLWLEVEV